MKTQAFEVFIDPARPYPQIWRLLVGAFLMVAVYVSGLAAIFVGILVIGGADTLQTWLERLVLPETPTAVMVLLFSFVGMALAPMVAARLLHKRKVKTLFGPFQPLVKDFLTALAVTFTLFTLLTAVWSIYFDAVPNIDFTIWISFLPLFFGAISCSNWPRGFGRR
jgi:Co/Zn/Cd efflux system component